MDPVVATVIIGIGVAAVNTIGLVIVALITQSVRNNQDKLADNVQKIEVATNSMKDALVKATAVAAEAEGNKQGRLELAAERGAIADRVAAEQAVERPYQSMVTEEPLKVEIANEDPVEVAEVSLKRGPLAGPPA